VVVFIRAEKKPKGGFTMSVIMQTKDAKGDVGLEVEVEGNKFPKHLYNSRPAVDPEKIPKGWKYVHDGSLRGEDNAEYIFDGPKAFDTVPDHVNALFKMFDDYGTKLVDSNRTSVHVHLNAQKWHMNRLCSFLALYYCFEEVLSMYCGDHRVGNLFCLRAKDAPAIIPQVRNFIASDGAAGIRDNHHYAGMNLSALRKYGSIENRLLRGAREPQLIINWVGILERLYKLSAEYPDPREVCGAFSQVGPLQFFQDILGDKAFLLRSELYMTDDEVRDSMSDGVQAGPVWTEAREGAEQPRRRRSSV
jgi:hypothetical protein